MWGGGTVHAQIIDWLVDTGLSGGAGRLVESTTAVAGQAAGG